MELIIDDAKSLQVPHFVDPLQLGGGGGSSALVETLAKISVIQHFYTIRKVCICSTKVRQETNRKLGSTMCQDEITDKCLFNATVGKVLISLFQLLITRQGIYILLLECLLKVGIF